MSGREPVAELGAEDYRIVRHTHDIELASKLMAAKLRKEWDGCPRYGLPSGCQTAADEEHCQHPPDVGNPSLEWVRIVPALPSSYAASEGWKYTYSHAQRGSRGAFPAVVFQ